MQDQEYAVLISGPDWELLGRALDTMYEAEALLEAVMDRLGQAEVSDEVILWLSRATSKLVIARERLESVLGL